MDLAALGLRPDPMILEVLSNLNDPTILNDSMITLVLEDSHKYGVFSKWSSKQYSEQCKRLSALYRNTGKYARNNTGLAHV